MLPDVELWLSVFVLESLTRDGFRLLVYKKRGTSSSATNSFLLIVLAATGDPPFLHNIIRTMNLKIVSFRLLCCDYFSLRTCFRRVFFFFGIL